MRRLGAEINTGGTPHVIYGTNNPLIGATGGEGVLHKAVVSTGACLGVPEHGQNEAKTRVPQSRASPAQLALEDGDICTTARQVRSVVDGANHTRACKPSPLLASPVSSRPECHAVLAVGRLEFGTILLNLWPVLCC